VRRTLQAATAVWTGPRGRAAVAAVLRWDESEKPRSARRGPRTVVRRLRQRDPVPPAYRALLLALWEARRLGARALTLSTDDADVVAQLLGTAPPAPEAVGAYLQVRALLNAFRSVAIDCRTAADDPDTAGATAGAASALDPAAVGCSDLPLWTAAAVT